MEATMSKNFEKLIKYCYDCCLSNNWDNEKVLKCAQNIDLPLPVFLEYAEVYAIKVLMMTKNGYRVKVQVAKRASRTKAINYGDVLDQLMKENDQEKIKEIIKKGPFSAVGLMRKLPDYAISKYNDKYDEVIRELKTKINYVIKEISLSQQKTRNENKSLKNKNNLPDAENLVKAFLESNYIDLQEFLNSQGVNASTFKAYLDSLQEFNGDLYQEYLTRLENIKSELDSNNRIKLKKMVYLVRNGVKTSLGTRPFDILDYVEMCNFSFDALLTIARRFLAMSEYKIIVSFYEKNKTIVDYTDNSINLLLREKIEIEAQKDEKGYPIPGTGRVITDEEKMSIINYLQGNKIPFNNKTYSAAMRRYINKELDLENNKRKR